MKKVFQISNWGYSGLWHFRICVEKVFLDSKIGINAMPFDKSRVEGHKM
jgi:hypothetical protein